MDSKKTFKIIHKHKIGILTATFFLFAITVFIYLFFIQRHFMTSFDEHDHLVSGFLMKNGRLIYKDFFSHHFPIPYYWTYLFTPLWSASASRTIAVYRLSIMFLYILVFSFIALSYKKNISKIALSLWLILISTFLSLYHGSLILSETFAGIFIAGILWLILPQLLDWEKENKFNVWLLIILISALFWTQPLTLFMFILPFTFARKKIWKTTLTGTLILNLLPLLIFYLKDQLTYFLQQGVWFNFNVYQNFFADKTSQGNTVSQTIISFITHQLALMTKFSNGNELFQFTVNASFLIMIIYFFTRKNKKALLSLLFLFFASRVREVKIVTGMPYNFGIFPYLLIGSASFVILIMLLRKRPLIASSIYIFLIAISINNSMKIFKQSMNPEYNYHVFWSYRQDIGEKIKSLTNEKEAILIYPHDVDLYYFADRFPPDRFTYWFPWIDSVAEYRNERLNALSTNPPAVIYIGNMDFKGMKNYYQKFFPDLTEDYSNITEEGEKQGIWLRNDLLGRINN